MDRPQKHSICFLVQDSVCNKFPDVQSVGSKYHCMKCLYICLILKVALSLFKKKSYVTTKVNNAIPVGLGSIRPSEYVLKIGLRGYPYSFTFPENARKMISQWCWTSAMSPSSDQAFTSQENMHKAILYWYSIYNQNWHSHTHVVGCSQLPKFEPMFLFLSSSAKSKADIWYQAVRSAGWGCLDGTAYFM